MKVLSREEKYDLPSLPPQAIKNLLTLIESYPQLSHVYPMMLMKAVRQNDKRPAYLVIAVPDDVVKNINGDDNKRDSFALLRVTKQASDLSKQRIILPGMLEAV